jgi:hypothetical protein
VREFSQTDDDIGLHLGVFSALSCVSMSVAEARATAAASYRDMTSGNMAVSWPIVVSTWLSDAGKRASDAFL